MNKYQQFDLDIWPHISRDIYSLNVTSVSNLVTIKQRRYWVDNTYAILFHPVALTINCIFSLSFLCFTVLCLVFLCSSFSEEQKLLSGIGYSFITFLVLNLSVISTLNKNNDVKKIFQSILFGADYEDPSHKIYFMYITHIHVNQYIGCTTFTQNAYHWLIARYLNCKTLHQLGCLCYFPLFWSTLLFYRFLSRDTSPKTFWILTCDLIHYRISLAAVLTKIEFPRLPLRLDKNDVWKNVFTAVFYSSNCIVQQIYKSARKQYHI